jgi:excisionase family DNA binding protein
MSQALFSVVEVADRLGLHVRTVRNYVREGRLKAVRIGKQYRIAREDLAALTGRPLAAFDPQPVRRHRHVEVSSIVEIDAISPDTASRVTNLLVSAGIAGHQVNEHLRVETIYNEERGRLKIILVGDMDDNAWAFKAINKVLET